MARNPLQQVKQQLSALEDKMIAEAANKELATKAIHPQQQYAARNLVHYLTLRSEDIRELQDALHIHGLSSLASSESHIHRQLQAILQRLGKQYSKKELDICTYDFGTKQI